MVDNNSDNKSDYVLLARLKQVARLWVTQLEQELPHEGKASMVEELLKIIQDDPHTNSKPIAKDEREGMIVTLKYWNDLILLRRSFRRQMVLQNEQECSQNLKHWLQYCVVKKDRATPSPVDVAQFDHPVSPVQRPVGKSGAAISPGGETPNTTRTSIINGGSTHDALEKESADGGASTYYNESKDESDLKPAAQPVGAPETREENLSLSHNTLVALYHGKHCTSKHGDCKVYTFCARAKALWKHASACSKGDTCDYEHCRPSKSIMQHYLACQRPSCDICGPVLAIIPRLKKDIQKQSKMSDSPKSSPGRSMAGSARKKRRTHRSTAVQKPTDDDDDETEDDEFAY